MSKKNPKDKPVSLPGHPRPSSAAWASEAGSLAAANPAFLAEHGATIPVPPQGVVQCRPEAPCRLTEIDPDMPGSSDGKAAAEAELAEVRAR
ncbi:polyphosphate kinase, partial [Methylobacterium frigidaeris]